MAVVLFSCTSHRHAWACWSPSLNPFFPAFAAGAMIFIAVHELVPMAKRYGNLPLFGYGMLMSVAVYLVLRHPISP